MNKLNQMLWEKCVIFLDHKLMHNVKTQTNIVQKLGVNLSGNLATVSNRFRPFEPFEGQLNFSSQVVTHFYSCVNLDQIKNIYYITLKQMEKVAFYLISNKISN